MADCINVKIDSNSTGLAFAEEECPGELPAAPVWYEREPNEYSNFGGEITTLARTPINASRQRKKGTTTDLDASGGFNEDITQNNMQRLLQGFFFTTAREKATTKPINGEQVTVTAAVASSDTFTAASGLDRFRVGQLVLVSGAVNAANNGVFEVTSVAAGSLGVSGSLVDETFSDEVIITVVGEQLSTAAASMALTGSLGVLTLASAPDTATGTLTIDTGNAAPGDTVTIGGVTYTFAAAPAEPYEVPVGSDDAGSAANLVAAINGNVLGTPAHDQVTAEDNEDGTLDVTAIIAGAGGNAIATTANGSELSWGDATLSGGNGRSFYELGLTVGEWVYLGADASGQRFANNQGYARIAAIADTTLRFDKTTWEPEAEVGTGLAIRIFVGTVIRNEKDPDLIVGRSYQFERTLGRDADGTQAEYIVGAHPNEFTLTGETAGKFTVDMSFMALDVDYRKGSEGLKSGTRYAALGEDAFNASSDIVRMRMSLVDATTSVPDALFAYVTSMSLAINNGMTAVKAMASLGGIGASSGDFEVGGEVTAFFATVDPLVSIRQNADVTFDVICAKKNAGWLFDIPLLSLGGGSLNVASGEPITVPLETSAAENAEGYTALYVNFGFLPDTAMPAV